MGEVDFRAELDGIIDDATDDISDEIRAKLARGVEQAATLIRMAAGEGNSDLSRRLYETARVPLVTATALLFADAKRRQNRAVARLFEVATTVAVRAAIAAV